MYIIKPLEDEATNDIVAKFENLIKNNGGEIEKTDRWGKRRLAYAIDDINDGYYVLVHFVAQPEAVAELDRVMKITDEILRHMIIKQGE
jgi:small subunit ribosomal protein S6